MDALFQKGIRRLRSGKKFSSVHKSASKNLFLSAYPCWDAKRPLRGMEQKFKLGGIIGFGVFYLEIRFCNFKICRLHAILNDAAEAVVSHCVRISGYCYLLGRRPNSCLFGHVIAPSFILSPKTPSAFYFQLCRPLIQYVFLCTRFWARRFERFYWVGSFLHGILEAYSLCHPKMYRCTKQALMCTRNVYTPNCVKQWRFRLLRASQRSPQICERQTFCQKDRKVQEYWQLKGKRVGKLRRSWLPKFRCLSISKQIEERKFDQVIFSKTRSHSIVQSARKNCLISGQGSIWSYENCNVNLLDCFKFYRRLSIWAQKLVDWPRRQILDT